MKLKHVAAAVLAVASASSAFAGVTDTSGGNSELFLVVYGTGLSGQVDASYTLDLGILEKSFLAAPSLSAILSGANWDAFAASVDLSTAKWAVMGGDNTGTTAGARNLLTTVQVGSEGAAATLTTDNMQFANGEIDAYLAGVNQTGTHASVANGDSFNKKGGTGYFLELNGNVLNNNLSFDNSNLIGVSSTFESLSRTSTGNAVSTLVLPGSLSLAKVGSSYQLSYQVAAVPEPGGAALALTALGVLGFVGRRRKLD